MQNYNSLLIIINWFSKYIRLILDKKNLNNKELNQNILLQHLLLLRIVN